VTVSPQLHSPPRYAFASAGNCASCHSEKVTLSESVLHAVRPLAVVPHTTCAAGVGAL
jgi:hypothetical protein